MWHKQKDSAMREKLIILKHAKEGILLLRHLLAGRLMNIRKNSQRMEQMIHEYAKSNPEILELKPRPNSQLTLRKMLEINVRDSNEMTKTLIEQSK